MRNQLKQWLTSQKGIIEEIICEAAQRFVEDKKRTPNFLFDLRQCQEEAYNLAKGNDLCYDRYTMGMFYSLWYQGRRLNTSLPYILDFVENAVADRKPLEIFDLGAGTGAVQIALGLCLEAAAQNSHFLPAVRVINVDISPFMLDFNRSYLWPAFCQRYPTLRRVRTEFTVNSWTNPDNIHLKTPYIVASYLFDHQENKDEIAGYFKAVVSQYQPEKLVLLTSNQINKRRFLDAVATGISGKSYSNDLVPAENIFQGPMTQVQQFRTRFNAEYGNILSANTPQWNEGGFYARQLTKINARLALDFGNDPRATASDPIDLYQPSIRVRKEIVLNPQQRKAAEPNNRSTIITGPAGCGKSIVITERIKNLCEKTDYSQSLNILVTTFNISLTDYLATWLEQILDVERAKRKGRLFYFDNNKEPNIWLYHFDVLSTRIGKHLGILELETQQKNFLNESIDLVCNQLGINRNQYPDILTPDFLYMEYIRVIYGQKYDTLEKYQRGERSGRPFRLNHNDFKRELIWKVIRHFLTRLEQEGRATIQTRRHKLLHDLEAGLYNGKFSHIFVDEFQDCTQADYDIFYGLLSDNNQLVIAGDYAQAVHLGKSASPPREGEIFAGPTPMRPREFIKLEGSYRLPFRISECIKPLSAFIQLNNENDTDVITPYKGAPPGARPIVIYAKSTEAMKEKILWCIWHFQVFDIFDPNLPRRKKLTILESDFDLSQSLNGRVPEIAHASTILKLKGMENDCIVWSTREKIEHVEDVYYYIYTILTRTCSILIIALFDDTPDYAYEALSKMERTRLMIWDQETLDWFNQKVAGRQSPSDATNLTSVLESIEW